MKYILFFILSFLCSVMGAVYQPASSRFTTYSPGVIQGIAGGIPSRSGGTVRLVAAYGWDAAASASTNAAAFNSALAASSEGDIISIPAGTFSITQLNVSYLYPNRTVRGAGMGLTILKPTSNEGFRIGGGQDYGNSFNPSSTITAMTKDSAVITVTDGSGFPSPSSEGQYRIGQIQLANEATTPVLDVQNQPKARNIEVVMVSRSGNNITLSQPLPSAFAAGATGAVFELGSQLVRFPRGIGVEDLTIDGDSGTMNVALTFDFCSGCWAKGVKVIRQNNFGIQIYNGVNLEIRQCYIDGDGFGSNHAGLLWNNASYSLVEDNIAVNLFTNFQINFASTANIFGYNFLGTGVLNCNHGPHNSYNLYEGNVMWYIQPDGYFGGCSEDTDFRNWFRGGLVTQSKRFTRNRNIIGNVVGTSGTTYATDGSEHWGEPNIGNNTTIGTSEMSTGDYPADWNSALGRPKTWSATITTMVDPGGGTRPTGTFTLDSGDTADFLASWTAAGSNAGRHIKQSSGASPLAGTLAVTGVVGNVATFNDYSSFTLMTPGDAITVTPSAGGFQEKDLDVANTTIRKGNYYVLTGDIPVGESVLPDTIPNSYYYTAKPSWFPVSSPWPAIDPAAPTYNEETIIPAAIRFYNPGDPPPSGPTITTGTLSIGGALTIGN